MTRIQRLLLSLYGKDKITCEEVAAITTAVCYVAKLPEESDYTLFGGEISREGLLSLLSEE